MSGHTPGPWTQWGTVIGSLGYHMVANIVAPTVNTHDVRPLDLGDPLFDEQMANARLIAAAPELLQACKVALNDRMFTEWPGVATVLIDAIAKAEGSERTRAVPSDGLLGTQAEPITQNPAPKGE